MNTRTRQGRRFNRIDPVELRRLIAWYDGIGVDYAVALRQPRVKGELAELNRLARSAGRVRDLFAHEYLKRARRG